MKYLVFFLEERSAKEMLEGVLSRLLPEGIKPYCFTFDGKQDLENQLVRKLRGWQKPDSVFLIMRDKDSEDCIIVKKRLLELCHEAGKQEALVRIACRELESFYFGDLSAVEKGLGLNDIVHNQQKRKYRVPDKIINPSAELEKLTKGVYQKIGGSRSIGALLSIENNTSHSFNVLITGIRKLIATA